ncbi:MAG: hypothetical protein AAF423_04585 [Pseudomonadota bacterium]
MMDIRNCALWVLLAAVFSGTPVQAELLGKEWITEAEMKKQSAFARQHSLVLVGLNCRFRDGVESPGREDVIFRAEFEQVIPPIGWGWTFDANAPNRAVEEQARNGGFSVATEDYFEMTGVTWVRCKVWHRP